MKSYKIVGLLLLILLIFPKQSYSEENKNRITEKFLKCIINKECDEAEKLLSYDADADLRLSIINKKELKKNVEGFKLLEFKKELCFKTQKIVLYGVKNSKELLAFVLVKRGKRYKILNFVPLESLSILKFTIVPHNLRKIDELSEKIKKRVKNYNFALVDIEKKRDSLLVTTVGIRDSKIAVPLLKIRGRFSIRKIEKHSRHKLEYFPMIGMKKNFPEYVSYHDIVNDKTVKKVIRDRNSFGVSEIKISFNANGKLNLIRFYRNYKNRKNRIEIAAILDNYIIKRVKLREGFLAGVLWIENIPNVGDARLLSSIIGSSYPCSVEVKLIK